MPCSRTQQASLPACSPHYLFYVLSAKQESCEYLFVSLVFLYRSALFASLVFFVESYQKTLKHGIHCLQLGAQYKDISVEKKPPSALVVPLVKCLGNWRSYVKIMMTCLFSKTIKQKIVFIYFTN